MAFPRRTWPGDPDGAPIADQIARAFVAAARELGDLDRLREAVAPDGVGYAALITRSRWLALGALQELWPRAPLRRLGSLLGAAAPSCHASLLAARVTSWWSTASLERVIAAI